MVSYNDVKTEIQTNWALAPGVPIPTIYDMDLRFDISYPDTAFLKMYANMPIKTMSQSNNGGLTYRKQNFIVKGVYTTYAAAKTALQEFKRIITEKKGWLIGGKASIEQNGLRHIFSLPCYEKAYLLKNEW